MSTERMPGGRTPDERIPAEFSRAGQRALKRFRRTSLVTFLVLALAAGGLGAAAVLRGPTLGSASINLGASIARDGQKLVLHADQAIGPIDEGQVEVEPATPFSVEASGTDITLTFSGILDYATEYRVRVDDVNGTATGLTGSLDYTFQTPDVQVYSLLRRGGADAGAGKPTDQVLRSTLSAGADSSSEVAFEAPRIQQYAATDTALAAITLDDAGTSTLQVSVEGAAPATVYTPTGGRVQNLSASTSAHLFGFTVNGGTDATGRVFQNALFVFDPLGTTGRAEEVTGFDGAPLRVVDWAFVPGTSSIVAQGTDQQLYLLDGLGAKPPTPLGRHTELRGFLPGELKLIVADSAGTSTIDLTTGAVEPLVQTAPEVDPAFYPGTIVTLQDGVTIRQYDDVDYSSASPVVGSVILYADASGTRELFRPAAAGARVRGFCVSPNGQYLAVETIAADSVSDGYALPGYSDMTTWFVRIADGVTSRGVPGFLPDWCQ